MASPLQVEQVIEDGLFHKAYVDMPVAIPESMDLPDRLVTTQHDPRHSSAVELAALYYERRKVDTRPAV